MFSRYNPEKWLVSNNDSICNISAICVHSMHIVYAAGFVFLPRRAVYHDIQWSLSGLNTDGSFTSAVSNSFLSPLEKSHSSRFGIIYGDFLFYIDNGILCVLIRIASKRRF